MTNLFSQQQYWDIREEIISRHENGNKKLLVKYSGKGSSEIIVERITYTNDDKRLSIEKPLENTIVYFDYNFNGKLMFERPYKNDLSHGEWIFYDKEGKKNRGTIYLNGKIDGHTFYDENEKIDKDIYFETWDDGNLSLVSKYDFGHENYFKKLFDYNSKLVSEFTSTKRTTYYDTGQVQEIDILDVSENNDKNGRVFYYLEDGTLYFEWEYLDWFNGLSFENKIKMIKYDVISGDIRYIKYFNKE